MNTYYVGKSEDNSLTHFGVKGMKWKKGRKTPEQKPMSYADRLRAQYEQKQAKIEAAKAAKAAKAKTAAKVSKSKSIGKKKLEKYAKAVIRGKYGVGQARIEALRKRGLSSKDLIRVQGRVNQSFGINSGASKNFVNAVNKTYGTKGSSSKKKSSSKSKGTRKKKVKVERNKYGYRV